MSSKLKNSVVGVALLLASLGVGRSYYAPLDEALGAIESSIPLAPLSGILNLGEIIGLERQGEDDPRFKDAPEPDKEALESGAVKPSTAAPPAQDQIGVDVLSGPLTADAASEAASEPGGFYSPLPGQSSTTASQSSSEAALPQAGGMPALNQSQPPTSLPFQGAIPGAKTVPSISQQPLNFEPSKPTAQQMRSGLPSSVSDTGEAAGTAAGKAAVPAPGAITGTQMGSIAVPGFSPNGLTMPPGVSVSQGAVVQPGSAGAAVPASPFTGLWEGKFEGGYSGTIAVNVSPFGQAAGVIALRSGKEVKTMNFNSFVGTDGSFIVIASGFAPMFSSGATLPGISGKFSKGSAEGLWAVTPQVRGAWLLTKKQ